MSVNKSTQTIEERFYRTLADIQRQLRDIKAVQLIGADNTLVKGSNLSTSIHIFTPGQILFYEYAFDPTLHILGQPQIATSYYIDVDKDTDMFNNYLWPDGPGLSTPQRKMLFSPPDLSWAASNDALGQRLWYARAENTDTVSHTVYSYAKVYSIDNPGTSA